MHHNIQLLWCYRGPDQQKSLGAPRGRHRRRNHWSMGLFDERNIVLEPQTIIINAGGKIDDADGFIKMSWTVREMIHVMTTRQSANPVWHGMPALTTERFVALHMTKLATDPGAYWWDIKGHPGVGGSKDRREI